MPAPYVVYLVEYWDIADLDHLADKLNLPQYWGWTLHSIEPILQDDKDLLVIWTKMSNQ